ncbi:hypothetical protein LPJ62_006915, partial [Coemansia sp. RSA 2167]
GARCGGGAYSWAGGERGTYAGGRDDRRGAFGRRNNGIADSCGQQNGGDVWTTACAASGDIPVSRSSVQLVRIGLAVFGAGTGSNTEQFHIQRHERDARNWQPYSL